MIPTASEALSALADLSSPPFAAFLGVKHSLKAILASSNGGKGGSIVLTASQLGLDGAPELSACKFGFGVLRGSHAGADLLALPRTPLRLLALPRSLNCIYASSRRLLLQVRRSRIDAFGGGGSRSQGRESECHLSRT